MLLVTDSPDNESLFRRSLEQSGLRLHLDTARSANDAISLLKHVRPYDDLQLYPAPEVIVVDLAHEDPAELLLWLQTRPDYRNTHTVVIASHPDPASVTKAYSLRANAVLARPIGTGELAELYRSLCRVWSLSEPVTQ